MKKTRPVRGFCSPLLAVLFLVLTPVKGQTANQPQSEQRAQAHYQSGMDHLSRKELGKAYVSFSQAIQAFAAMDPAFHHLAEIDFLRGKYARAADWIGQAIQLQPQKAEYHCLLASIHIQAERNRDALSVAQKALLLDPKGACGHFLLGLSHKRLHQTEEARDSFEHTIALDPSFAAAYFLLGSLYSREQETFRQASENFKKALSLGLDRPDVRKSLASVLVKLEEYEEAVRLLDRAVKDSPADSELYYFLSTAYRRLGMTAQAASALEKYQALSAAERERKDASTTALAHYNTGMKHFLKDDLEKAYDSFSKAIDFLSDMDRALHRLALIDLEWGNRQRASEWIRKAIRVQPQRAEYHFVLAQCLELTDVSGAREAIQQALDLDPSVAGFHNLLGNLLFSRGNPHLQIITLRTRQEQDEVFSRLEAGASFSEMARRHSTHPTGPSGGYLGEMQLNHLSQPLRDLVEAMEEGSPARLDDPGLGYAIILELNPEQARSATAQRSLGRAIRLLREGSIDPALLELNQAVSLDPSSARAHLLLGWIQRLHGSPYRIQQSQAAFQEALRLDPTSSWTRLHLALLYLESGQLEEASAVLKTQTRAISESPVVLAFRGEVARRLGHSKEAEKVLGRALQLAPELAAARAYLGLVYLESNRLEEAVQEIEAALQDTSGRSDLHLKAAGVSLQAAGQVSGPEAFRLDPPYAEARLSLARAYRLLGKPQKALDLLYRLEPFLITLPARSVRRSTLRKWQQEMSFQAGLSYEALDAPTDAIRFYHEALQIHEEHPASRRRLANLLYERGFYTDSLVQAAQAEARGAPMGDSPLGRRIAEVKKSKIPFPTPPGSETSVLSRFRGLAYQLRNSLNEYYGSLQIPLLQNLLKLPGLSREQSTDLHGNLSQQLLKMGEIERAIHHLDLALVQSQSAEVYFRRGVTFLRQSEVKNCLGRHNADSCLLPLQGGGLHETRRPAENARKNFERFLELEPDSLTGRWLLNLTSMALGDYPDGVAEKYLIPPTAFESDYSIGRFPDIAPQLGLDTFNLSGGSIVDDFDNDGFLDIMTSTSDPDGPLKFYQNLGNGRFKDSSSYSGVDQQLGGLNSIAADYDNDGDLDVLVLRGAWLFDQGKITNSLLRNNGDRTFSDVTRTAGLAEPALPTQAAVWGDFDNDGDLDLYVANEDRSEDPTSAEAYPSQLFRNNGDGTFTDIARAAGVTNYGYAKGVTSGDFDNDGDLDLYVSNVGPNRLYRNEGNGTFVDMAEELGVIEPVGRSFAPWFFDYNNDGWLDLFVSAYDAAIENVARDYLGLPHGATRPRLYRNDGGKFTEVGRELGLDHPYLPMGANFGDLDHDGFLDIYLGTGDPAFETLVPNVMLRNDRGERFQNVTTSGGFGHLQKGHGISFADIDNDGDQDIYHQLGGHYPGDKYSNALFQNPGHQNRFLYLKLVGSISNRAAVGARVKLVLETPEGVREVHRAVGSVSSFGGSPLRQEIGLGKANRIRRLEVWWPTSGRRQAFVDVPLDQLVQIIETENHFQILPLVPIRLGR